MAGVGREIGRADLLSLAARVGLRPIVARRVLDEVSTGTANVHAHLHDAGCFGPVSASAARAVQAATARLT